MAPVLSLHITVSFRNGSGQASRLQNQKNSTILTRAYPNQHKILIDFIVLFYICVLLAFFRRVRVIVLR